MKAVIMAGGEGRRLKPVTGEHPKPLVPLLGRPLMEHIIKLLKSQGFDDICAAVKYRAEDIMSLFGDGSIFNVQLSYSVEEEALGTAGAVKNCRSFYGNEDFLVISGDAACDFKLSELMERHNSEKAAVTVALARCSEPLSYGLAITDEGQIIKAFIEKPRWSRVVTDLVNTGIYVISPRVMDLVPDKRTFDFAKELFPLLIERGEKLLGVPMDGYWCDVGNPLSYYRCCCDALEGRLKIEAAESFAGSSSSEAAAEPEEADVFISCPCKSRAELMGVLSQQFMSLGADYSDGLRIENSRFNLHICPCEKRSALSIAVSSPDAEYAHELALSAKDIIEKLNL